MYFQMELINFPCNNFDQLHSLVLYNIFHLSTAVAIRCKDGVVFGVEKLVLSKLYEYGANKRIFHIDSHIGMVG